jgi:hypothetical protein
MMRMMEKMSPQNCSRGGPSSEAHDITIQSHDYYHFLSPAAVGLGFAKHSNPTLPAPRSAFFGQNPTRLPVSQPILVQYRKETHDRGFTVSVYFFRKRRSLQT